jgi:phosphoglycerate dehydrogenase-like enzyme
MKAAAPDVIEAGPHGREHLLRQTPYLLLTPHMASFTPGRQERVERFVEEQVGRFVRGKPLWYQVDLGRLETEAMG